ncbi:MAG: SH3 domain-containing protein [Pseudomonadota bacterium]
MRIWRCLQRGMLCALLVLSQAVGAEEESFQRVQVADPFVEMHTGAGSAFPIFHVVDRGEEIELLLRRHDWFKIRTARGVEGWVSREQIARTLNLDGSDVQLAELTQDDFNQRRWEGGVMGGDFGGAAVISTYAAYHFTPNLSAEASLSHALGDVSNSIFFSFNGVNQPFPEWTYSPFFSLGSGVIQTEPDATLVASEDRSDQFLRAGIGVRRFLGKRFVLRFEYDQMTIITSRDDNDKVKQWKLGVSVFF